MAKRVKDRTRREAIDDVPMAHLQDQLKDVKKIKKQEKIKKERIKNMPAKGEAPEDITGLITAGMRVDRKKLREERRRLPKQTEGSDSEEEFACLKEETVSLAQVAEDAQKSESESEAEPDRPAAVEKECKKPTETAVKKLLTACSKGLSQMLEVIKEEKNISIWTTGKNKMSPLLVAVTKGQPKLAKWLLYKGAKPRAVDGVKGWNALMWACAVGNVEAVEVLVAKEPTLVNRVSPRSGATALHCLAACKDSVKAAACAEKLLKAGASPAILDGKNKLAVAYVAEGALKKVLLKAQVAKK